jgi:hypothetical protein
MSKNAWKFSGVAPFCKENSKNALRLRKLVHNFAKNGARRIFTAIPRPSVGENQQQSSPVSTPHGRRRSHLSALSVALE